MKLKIAFVLLAISVALSGCGTVQVRILKSPENRSETQRQLDNLECHNLSKVSGPCLFGLGLLMYQSMAKERFTNCMESRGYVVDK